MEMTLRQWIMALENGQILELQVTGAYLQPTLTQGDKVTVRRVPFASVKEYDIVLCVIGGNVGLRRVSQSRQVFGVRCVEVADATGAVHFIQEGSCLGKVVAVCSATGKVSVPMSPLASALRAIKHMLVPRGVAGFLQH